jgi:glucose/arabinose dehydrogenase
MIWSYGHRNVEGLAWDGQGKMWATEHGRSGLQTGLDELNLIEPGINYGWPMIEGDATSDGMRVAAVHSGPTEPWAPAGIASYGGSLYFGGLRGESLYQALLGLAPLTVKSHFEHEFGRIRAVAVGPDHQLYFTTSNTDGRGLPRSGDDQVVRINPDRLH